MKLQQRVLALVLILLLLVLGVTLAIVSRAAYSHALDRGREALLQSRLILADRIDSQGRVLREAAGTLAKDDALRQALFDFAADRESIRVALENHRRRTSADRAILADLDGTVLVDTSEPEREGKPFPFQELLSETQEGAGGSPGSSRLVEIGGGIEKLVVTPYYVPVSAPRPSLWLVLGERLGDDWARDLARLAGHEISLVRRADGDGGEALRVLASSHDADSLDALRRAGLPSAETVDARDLAGKEYFSLAVEFPDGIAAILDRPTAPTRLDSRKLVWRFAWIAIGAALLAVGGAWLLARSVTGPIRSLESAARRIATGEYAAELPIDEEGEVGNLAREFAGMQRAVGEREAAIEQLAFFDDLTGLANRNRFRDELSRRLAEAERDHDRLAVALVDVDHFHDINDTLGHHVGDRLLLVLAERLEVVASKHGLFVARLGGDEFALLIRSRGVAESRDVIAEVEAGLTATIDVEDVRIHLAASVGIALYPEHGGDQATLLRRAEVAMYAAKEKHSGSAFYDPAQDHNSIERLSLAGDLRRAINEERLELVYQPKLELASDRVREVEALLRWTHPRRGVVPPQEFIAVAERTGMIRELTGWVLDRALEQGAIWQAQGLDIAIAVNLSALDLLDGELPKRLASRLARAGFPPQRLILEITESSVMADAESARRLLDEIAATGVRVSVDDFGTGYSSLAHLQRLPVREIKVDRSFVIEMLHSADVGQIVRSIVDLGHNLGLVVVGEGVESRETLEALRNLGCDLAQGYFVSPPLSPARLALWVRERPLAGSAV